MCRLFHLLDSKSSLSILHGFVSDEVYTRISAADPLAVLFSTTVSIEIEIKPIWITRGPVAVPELDRDLHH
jgi:hypothetical protein